MRSTSSQKLDRALKSHRANLRIFAGLDKDGNALPATAENVAAARVAMAQFAALETKALKLAKKTEAHVMTFVSPMYTAHLPQADAAFFTQECYPLMSHTHNKFLASRGILALAHEQSLCELFVHMKHHEDFYFRLFASEHTAPWMERCVGMLGNYATLLRQRGEFHATFEVLKIDARVLARLTDVVTADGYGPHRTAVEREMEQENLRELTYKFLLIKKNLRDDLVLPLPPGLAPHEELGPELRVMMLFELKTDAVARSVDEVMALLDFAGHPLTMAGLAKATDLELWCASEAVHQIEREMAQKKKQKKKAKKANQKQQGGGGGGSDGEGDGDDDYMRTSRPLQDHVMHHRCAGCGRVEPYLNTFPRCGGCRAVFYHAPECQKQHWKAEHKRVCKALREQRKRQEQEEGATATTTPPTPTNPAATTTTTTPATAAAPGIPAEGLDAGRAELSPQVEIGASSFARRSEQEHAEN